MASITKRNDLINRELQGGGSVSVCVCVCVFCWTLGKKWRVLSLTRRTTVEVFLLQNGRNCISFFLPTFFSVLDSFVQTDSSVKDTTEALCCRKCVSYSSHLRNISEIERGNLSTWCDSSFWSLWQVLHSLTAHIGHWQLPGASIDISLCFAALQITT